MKSKTSFINPGILRNDFKSFGWIGAVYLLGMLLSVPLKLLMLHSNRDGATIDNISSYLRIFQFDSALQIILLVTVPILAGLLLFRYLQNDKAVDMVHALPVQRVTLYNTHILAGIIFLSLPLIVTALVSWALVAGLGISSVNAMAIFTWLGVSLLINLLFFLTSAATGMFTGISVVQGVISYILLVLPGGLSVLLLSSLRMYSYGFAFDYYCSTSISKLSPLVRIFESLPRGSLQTAEVIAYLLASAALYLLGRYLYQRRQLETAGSAITFPILRPFFKYGVTFCFMLLLGSYFKETQSSLAWTFFGYFLGAVLGYFLTEILLNKSWQVFHFKTVKGLLIYSLIVIGLIGAVNSDFTGYEKRLPPLADIESVYLDNSFHLLNEENNPQTQTTGVQTAALSDIAQITNPPLRVYKDTDSIAKIYALHQDIINNLSQGKAYQLNPGNDNYRQESVCLAYNLKNGSTFYRQYRIKALDYEASLKAVYESPEYRTLHYPILNLNPAMIKMLEVNAANVDKSVRIIDAQLISGAVAALQADAKTQTYEEMTRRQPAWGDINIFLDVPGDINNDNYRSNLSWEKSYVFFEQWLKDNKEYNNARIIPEEDIKYAIVARRVIASDNTRERVMKDYTQQTIADLENNPENLKITDPYQLEICLRTHGYDYRRSSDSLDTIYDVIFLLKNGRSFSGGFTEDSAPAFVQQFFAKGDKGTGLVSPGGNMLQL